LGTLSPEAQAELGKLFVFVHSRERKRQIGRAVRR
jgi:hypothetical protein